MAARHIPRPIKTEYLTPPNLLSHLGQFDLDPCSPEVRPWSTAARHFTAKDDGLSLPWVGRVWCNPPYDRSTAAWLARCASHGNAIALIFARTETALWFKEVWPKADSVFFLCGRLTFHHVDGTPLPFNGGAPSALVAYGRSNTDLLSCCGWPGQLVRLSS